MAGAQLPVSTFQLSAFEEDEILALDPERISDRQVREALSRAPPPRILSFKGTLFADMESFGSFLSQMGYPAEKLRNPRDGSYTYDVTWHGCKCEECPEIVGALAWYYEEEGMVPMLVGHSGGGVAVSRILYGLADAEKTDADTKPIPVWNPAKRKAESRYNVRDPVTGVPRRLSDLRVPYAAMIATGRLLRLTPFFPGCAEDAARFTNIPDSVEEFTGFEIEGDIFTQGTGPYRSLTPGTRPIVVRNVQLPSTTDHVRAFRMDGLAQNSQVRAWINAYRPNRPNDPIPTDTDLDVSNILHAADLWHSIKKHWCLEAQRLIRVRRAVVADSVRNGSDTR